MKLQVQHRTTYRYSAPASYSIQMLKLTPRREAMQRTLSWRLVTPGRHLEQTDAFGNQAHLLTLEGGHGEVSIHAEGVVETDDAFNGLIAPEGPLSPLVFVTPTSLTRSNASIEALASSVFAGTSASQAAVSRLMDAIATAVRYRPGSTAVSDTASDVIERGEGVCQDQAHVAIAVCRAAGVPARYVSGYMLSNLAEASTHAWVDVWLQDEGRWFSCDLTHGAVAGASQLRLAVGRDYLDAAPVRGMRRGGGNERLEVGVSVLDAAVTTPGASRGTIGQQAMQQ